METGSPGSSKRTRRIEEAVMEIDGVVGVRVWELPDRVEIGVVVAPSGGGSTTPGRTGCTLPRGVVAGIGGDCSIGRTFGPVEVTTMPCGAVGAVGSPMFVRTLTGETPCGGTMPVVGDPWMFTFSD